MSFGSDASNNSAPEDARSRSISLEVMNRLVASGAAERLLNASAPPVEYFGCWWAIPSDSPANDYVQVANPADAAVLDDLARRVRAAAGR